MNDFRYTEEKSVYRGKIGIQRPVGTLVMGHVVVDPPLNALSWNLKNSHVFSGYFLCIKMNGKNKKFQKLAEVLNLGGGSPDPPCALYKSKLKLSEK